MTMMKPDVVAVLVSSVPKGAAVSVEEGRGEVSAYSGLTTPCEIRLPNQGKKNYQIRISKEGYEDSVVVKSSERYQNPGFTGNCLWCIAYGAGLVFFVVDYANGADYSIPSTPINVSLRPDGSLPSQEGHQVPQPEQAPTLAEGKNPLRIKKWKYDQEEQKAEFEFTVVSEDADIFALRPWALQQIRKICNDEYAQANPGQSKSLLGFSLVSELDAPKLLVNVTVHRVRPMSHSYDAATRTGTLKVNVGKQGDANYAGAYKWALDNIGVICSSKEVAVEAGQPLAEGAMYEILSEKTDDDGTLEIKFRVVQ